MMGGDRVVRRDRARVEMAVNVRTDYGTFEAASQDLGIGGIFLVTTRSVPIDRHVALEFTLPHHVRATSVEAEVRWIHETGGRPLGMGLRFVNPSFGTTVAIHELLRGWAASDG